MLIQITLKQECFGKSVGEQVQVSEKLAYNLISRKIASVPKEIEDLLIKKYKSKKNK